MAVFLYGCDTISKRILTVPHPSARAARGAAVAGYARGSSAASDSGRCQDAGMASRTGTGCPDQSPATPVAVTPAHDHGRHRSAGRFNTRLFAWWAVRARP